MVIYLFLMHGVIMKLVVYPATLTFLLSALPFAELTSAQAKGEATPGPRSAAAFWPQPYRLDGNKLTQPHLHQALTLPAISIRSGYHKASPPGGESVLNAPERNTHLTSLKDSRPIGSSSLLPAD